VIQCNIRRTGFKDDFFFVAQWFPKFGVYETPGMRYATKGAWNCHQFHVNSEFYANHSVYDVKITVPKEYIVGTGGLVLDEREIDGGRKTITTRAEDIVDYAWTAWPGYAVFTDQWQHVKITLLLPKDRIEQVARQFTAVKNGLEYLAEKVGPFPYPHLTFVDPPAKGGGSGGMEYTTIFTSASGYRIPEFIHLPEMVTIHEFGHGYFMGIFASNEFEEPWLDEGVNSFWEERILDHYYGPNAGMMTILS
jgi:aminopeptidase N